MWLNLCVSSACRAELPTLSEAFLPCKLPTFGRRGSTQCVIPAPKLGHGGGGWKGRGGEGSGRHPRRGGTLHGYGPGLIGLIATTR